jgi:hypothetical protein
VPVVYIAYTENHVLMLDGQGVCVRVEALAGRKMSLGSLMGQKPAFQRNDGALRCIGAQYVACIDPTEPGGLAHMPRVGTSMLFAAVDPGGRIFCVRAGPLTHFESGAADDSGVHATPHGGVQATANDTQKQASLPDDYATDPHLAVSLGADDYEDDDVETSTYRKSSNPPPPPRSGYSTRGPTPPPTPKVPRLRPFVKPLAPAPTAYTISGSRGRPPAPSSHAWLHDLPVAPAGGMRRRGR